MRIVAGLEFWTVRKQALVCRDVDKAEADPPREPITGTVIDEPKYAKGDVTTCNPLQNIFPGNGKFLRGLTHEGSSLFLRWDGRNYRSNGMLINVIRIVRQLLLNNENARFNIKFFDNSLMLTDVLYNHNKAKPSFIARRFSTHEVDILNDQIRTFTFNIG